MALLWRKVKLGEVLASVRAEIEGRHPGEPLPAELVELWRLLRSELAGVLGEGEICTPQEIVDAIPDAAGMLDAGGHFVAVNRMLEALVGSGRSLGKTVLEVTRHGDLDLAAERAVAGTASQEKYALPSLDKVLEVSLSPLSRRGALAVFKDLTEAKHPG